MSILKKYQTTIFAVTIFGIAMGVMEAVIVVYLRKLFFPDGFGFPLTLPGDRLIIVAELVRELATVIMLLGLSWAISRSYLKRFAWFLFSFAIWDIFYYVGLKAFLGWPDSLLTWDILYLIPVTWVGPVLAPVISSVFMIILAFAFLVTDDRKLRVGRNDWILIWLGAILIYITFTWDFTMLIISNGLLPDLFNLIDNPIYTRLIASYVPAWYNWPLFIIGIILITIAIFRILKYRRKRVESRG